MLASTLQRMPVSAWPTERTWGPSPTSSSSATAALWPKLTQEMDQVVDGIYNQFKNAMPKD